MCSISKLTQIKVTVSRINVIRNTKQVKLQRLITFLYLSTFRLYFSHHQDKLARLIINELIKYDWFFRSLNSMIKFRFVSLNWEEFLIQQKGSTV